MPKKGDVHVVPSDKGWRVEVEGSGRPVYVAPRPTAGSWDRRTSEFSQRSQLIQLGVEEDQRYSRHSSRLRRWQSYGLARVRLLPSC